MYNKKCCSCLFGDRCVFYDDCEYYSTLDGESEDLELEQRIENGRRDYYQEWALYIVDNE